MQNYPNYGPPNQPSAYGQYPPPQPMYQPPVQPSGVPIDAEIQRIQFQIEQCRLQLSGVNASMASTRAHYSQHHVHGGGKAGHFVRGMQRAGKDGRLASMQPHKEQLQQQKLALEQQLSHLKMLKAQGITHVQPSNAPRPSGGPTSFGLMNLVYFLFIGCWLGFCWLCIAIVFLIIPGTQQTGQQMLRNTGKAFFLT